MLEPHSTSSKQWHTELDLDAIDFYVRFKVTEHTTKRDPMRRVLLEQGIIRYPRSFYLRKSEKVNLYQRFTCFQTSKFGLRRRA